jgi:hypothetical protein
MEDSPDLKQLNIDSSQPMTNEELLRRLIRLVVGIVLVGQDALRKQLPIWEAQAAQYSEKQGSRSTSEMAGSEEIASTQSAPPLAPWFPKEWEYRLIGLAFESPNYVKSGLITMLKAPRTVWRKTAPLRLPLDILGVTDFTRNWMEGFIERIQADMEELELVGKTEATPSRALGAIAINDIYDEVLNLLSESPELRDLVTAQTTSLTTEVIQEVRERTVSTDTLIEALVSKLLRRQQLPPGELPPTSPDQERKQEW